MNISDYLENTMADLVVPGKGILAADESTRTITQRFENVGLESTEDTRRAYRSMLLTTPGIGEYISGVILYEETLGQSLDDGTPMVAALADRGIMPGIKVDKGTVPLPNGQGDMITQGLDGLSDRLARYREQGARFAKWRDVYAITDHNPTALGLKANAEVQARYAAACQSEGIVPIVEPEVLLAGEHSIERAEAVSEAVLHSVFAALRRHKVALEYMILKPAMVSPGNKCPHKASPEEVADATLRVLKRCTPVAVPSINFLSGGQSPEEATRHLDEMNRLYENAPWLLSFSYARALQQPAMEAWRGDSGQVSAAQALFFQRARLNGIASLGRYSADMEG